MLGLEGSETVDLEFAFFLKGHGTNNLVGFQNGLDVFDGGASALGNLLDELALGQLKNFADTLNKL